MAEELMEWPFKLEIRSVCSRLSRKASGSFPTKKGSGLAKSPLVRVNFCGLLGFLKFSASEVSS